LALVLDPEPRKDKRMDTSVSDTRAQPTTKPQRSRELFVFLLLAVLIWPFIAVGVVAGWGFVVWMYYLFTGPPGPV
jgi:nitrate reductase NapE